MKLTTRACAAALMLTVAPLASAHQDVLQAPGGMPKLLLSAAIGFGGDDLASAEYEYGGDDDLEAGGGLYLGAGIEFPLDYQGDMAVRTSVGYQFDSLDASNGDASFERMPLEAMLMVGPGPHRLGVGMTYHTDIQYEYDDDYGTRIDAEFDDAVGFVVAYELLMAPAFGLSLKYTDIQYEENVGRADVRGKEIDGSNVSIGLTVLF